MTTYSTGTISVGSGSTSVTGVGTAWTTSGVRAGDLFTAAGLTVPIASVNSATGITLARAWPGSTQSAVNYDILMVDDGVRTLTAVNELLQALTGGTLTSLADLTGIADRLAYFSGANTMSLTTLTAWARSLLDDADVAAFWATIGATAGAAQAFRRANILATVTQSAGVPTGGLIERGSNANGEYVRFADGTQICWHSGAAISCTVAQGTLYMNTSLQSWTFPAAFSVAPAVHGSPGTTARFTALGVPSTSGVQYRVLSAFTDANTYAPTVGAIGRWF